MLRLFSDSPTFLPGFSYWPDFIDTRAEAELIGYCQSLPLTPMKFHGYEAKRKTLSFGYDYSFTSRKLAQGEAIPQLLAPLLTRVAAELLVSPEDVADVLVTEYPPGSVINWHRDAPPFKNIAGISLASDCTFRLRPYDSASRNRASTFSYHVQPRSLYLITGEARSQWEHSIQPVDATRYSITFRTLV